jgi:hypothetical protein
MISVFLKNSELAKDTINIHQYQYNDTQHNLLSEKDKLQVNKYIYSFMLMNIHSVFFTSEYFTKTQLTFIILSRKNVYTYSCLSH